MTKSAHAAKGYGQYCPLALAVELLGRRWTILVISRLLDGCTTYSEIHKGIPRISPSLLSTRLTELEHAGLITREKIEGRERYRYVLTEAGQDLDDIVMQLAVWGQHWARDNEMDDLDIGFLAWSMSMRIDTNAMPADEIVLEFEFSGAPTEFRRFWLVHRDGKVDMCLKHPGLETDLLVKADLGQFIETWRGFRDLETEIRMRRVVLTGAKAHRTAFPKWLLMSSLAPYSRKYDGREKRLCETE